MRLVRQRDEQGEERRLQDYPVPATRFPDALRSGLGRFSFIRHTLILTFCYKACRTLLLLVRHARYRAQGSRGLGELQSHDDCRRDQPQPEEHENSNHNYPRRSRGSVRFASFLLPRRHRFRTRAPDCRSSAEGASVASLPHGCMVGALLSPYRHARFAPLFLVVANIPVQIAFVHGGQRHCIKTLLARIHLTRPKCGVRRDR